MYSGTLPIPTAKVFVEELVAKGIPHLFLTNNATRTPEEVANYLKEICQIDTSPDFVYTSGIAAVEYVSHHHPSARTFIVGEPALIRQAEENELILANKEIDVVIQSLDRTMTYEKLVIANNAIRNGAEFIATNPDTSIPTENGFIPGAGSLTAFLKTSTQKDPIIIGKPYSHIMDGALEKLRLSKDEVAMVGDNYNTDILAGINYGIDTILTLTGFTRREDLEYIETKPTHIVNNLTEWIV
ncbi:TIGR01457 family HAD-type hydrolase [Jeotgalibaca ciconiae]|uniref:TIGR01457 family HAD-type hydrolase n=2 Tax=Jeotgalibaca ciconiae TaxID=2496265 RepID=A0A3S9HEJ0_9LACT|nr:TIGR01457 family HAD-type hydrolase [Jeotgalibaca ciconiae]